MLVYFDPWLAGVVLPSLIIVGLIAIPYIDKNPKGNGYYTFNERKVEITLFLFGFVILWSSLIVLGTFLRGPNWNFFGPFEYWDTHKLEALTNVNLSEYFWVRAARRRAADATTSSARLPGILLCWCTWRCLPVVAGRGAVQDVLADKLGAAALLRDGLPVPDDDVAADQDAASVDLQPEVHRGDSRDLLQYLRRLWLKKRLSGTPITSTS